MDPELSIVVPAYNEALRLPALLRALAELADARWEVIVVDDGSRDDTAGVVGRHQPPWDGLRLVRLEENRGKGAALRAGVAAAAGQTIVAMDADLATDLSALPPLLEALGDVHVAIGSRAVPGSVVVDGASHRRLLTNVFRAMVRVTTNLRVADTQCGFKAFRAPVARLLFSRSSLDGFAQDVEVLDQASRLGFRIAEIPVTWTNVAGSKVSPWRHGPATLRDLLVLACRRRREERRGVELELRTGPETVDTLRRLAPDAVVSTHSGMVHVRLPVSSRALVARIVDAAGPDAGVRWAAEVSAR